MTMIASVLHLERASMKALKVTDPYSIHRIVYSLYQDVRSDSEKQGSTASGILYADQGGDYRGRKILMLADREPKPQIDKKYGEVIAKTIPDDFLAHQKYRFKVIINPTRRGNVSRKLVPVRGRDDIASWFTERATKSWGFDAKNEHLQVDKIDVLKFKDKSQRDVTMAQAHIQGLLSVTDASVFKNSFRKGIGRGRAFGCGLLQIVPQLDNPFS